MFILHRNIILVVNKLLSKWLQMSFRCRIFFRCSVIINAETHKDHTTIELRHRGYGQLVLSSDCQKQCPGPPIISIEPRATAIAISHQPHSSSGYTTLMLLPGRKRSPWKKYERLRMSLGPRPLGKKRDWCRRGGGCPAS